MRDTITSRSEGQLMSSIQSSSYRAAMVLSAMIALPAAIAAASAPQVMPAPHGPPSSYVAGMVPSPATPAVLDTAVLAGGCFWGMELVYEHVKGVVSVVSGYAGGRGPAPSYEKVSGGRTDHAESVQIIYDPSQLSYPDILRIFFSAAHDPTQKNRQGPDVGKQYRSAIFHSTPSQAADAREYIRQLGESKYFSRPIVTEVSPLQGFHEAEAYHQDFALHNPHLPYIIINDLPRLEQLKTKLPQFYTADRAP